MIFEFLNGNTFGIKNWIIAVSAIAIAYLIPNFRKMKGDSKMAKDKNYEKEEDDEKVFCTKCETDITDNNTNNNTEQFTCEECYELFCDDCTIQFKNLGTIVCKSCVDEAYPREQQVVEKIVEKFVEVPKETIKVMGFSEPIL